MTGLDEGSLIYLTKLWGCITQNQAWEPLLSSFSDIDCVGLWLKMVLFLTHLSSATTTHPDLHHLSTNAHCAQTESSSVHAHLSEEVINIWLIWWRYSYKRLIAPSHSFFSKFPHSPFESCFPSPLSSVHLPYVCDVWDASITCSLERGWWSDSPPWLCSKNNRANFPAVRRSISHQSEL